MHRAETIWCPSRRLSLTLCVVCALWFVAVRWVANHKKELEEEARIMKNVSTYMAASSTCQQQQTKL